MTITLIVIGETATPELRHLIDHYVARLRGYMPFGIEVLPDPKIRRQSTPLQLQEAERQAIESRLLPSDIVVLLDEHGKQYSSRAWADQLQRYMASGAKRLVLVIGGPYGFAPALKAKYASRAWSLGSLTLTHEMARLLVVEQLYRAGTILHGDPYHHD